MTTTRGDASRTLVLCFDGTASQYNETNTNVVKFFSLLKKDFPEKQVVYYQSGIGTYANPGMWNHLLVAISKVVDLAVAWYLEAHVLGGYEFLMKHYRTGDKICLFGFSRGAYTARALAGMLHKVGLLPADNDEQIPFAYTMYKRDDPKGIQQSFGFKSTFSRSVTIDFVGVWDTVSSVGLIIPRHLPFTSSNHIIRTFRHAISLDERRAKFSPNLWHRNAPNEVMARKDPERGSGIVGEHTPGPVVTELDDGSEGGQRSRNRKPTDVEEVWFAGCHSDVGGGSVADTTEHSLSAITLRWMVRECIRTQSGILFDNAALRHAGIPQGSTSPFTSARKLSPAHQPLRIEGEGALGFSTGTNFQPSSLGLSHVEIAGPSEILPRISSESGSNQQNGKLNSMTDQQSNGDRYRLSIQELDDRDARSPLHDPLRIHPFWWLVEFLPLVQSFQDSEGNWHRKIRINAFRGRKIETSAGRKPKVHTTVRMKIQTGTYTPKADWDWDKENPEWVE